MALLLRHSGHPGSLGRGQNLKSDGLLARALKETGFVPVDLGGLIEGGKLQQFGGPLNALHLDLLKRL